MVSSVESDLSRRKTGYSGETVTIAGSYRKTAEIRSEQKSPAHNCAGLNHSSKSLLFHPDYTVGIGIAPIRLQGIAKGETSLQVADFTASGESHPALKNCINVGYTNF